MCLNLKVSFSKYIIIGAHTLHMYGRFHMFARLMSNFVQCRLLYFVKSVYQAFWNRHFNKSFM